MKHVSGVPGWRGLSLAAGLLLGVINAVAQTADITISGEGRGKHIISLAGVRADTDTGRLFATTLKGDLERSGWFKVADGALAPVSVTGGCHDAGGGLRADCRITWSNGSINWGESGSSAEARRLAHLLSDEITRRVAGKQGMAASRIVMVGRRGQGRDLYACDADGGSMVRLTHDERICLSPRWAAAGKEIYYTAFLKGSPAIYRIDTVRNRREQVSNFPGLNTGACISPDGKLMALVLSRTGNPELYVMNLLSRKLTRLTFTRHAAEASPSWSPDGRQLVYVADTSGQPHLYVIDQETHRPRRLPSSGSENVSPDWGPNGKIVYASRIGGGYEVRVMDPRSGQSECISTRDADYEDPAWAPDGRHVVCTRTVQYRPSLYLLDTLGDPPIPLFAPHHRLDGDWYSPDWSR